MMRQRLGEAGQRPNTTNERDWMAQASDEAKKAINFNVDFFRVDSRWSIHAQKFYHHIK